MDEIKKLLSAPKFDPEESLLSDDLSRDLDSQIESIELGITQNSQYTEFQGQIYPDNQSSALDKLEQEIGDNFGTKKYMQMIAKPSEKKALEEI